jgi:capsular exopolysaccharide synthesis family protein
VSRTFEALQRVELERAQQTPVSAPVSHIPAATVKSEAAVKSVRVGEEEVLKLVQRVFRSAPDAPRVVVFSGITHGDGCTWVSSSAAMTLAAQTSASMCVIDANLRTPGLHNVFGIDNTVGFTDAMAYSGAIRTYAQQISGSNLWVMPCGSVAGQSASSMHTEILRARIAELRSEFDYVLIDAPPINLYADAVTVARMADGIILVLQSNSTRREAALKAKETCETAQVRLLGAVLNKRTFPIPQNIYSRL